MEALQGQAQSAAGASSSQVTLTMLTGQDVRSTDMDRAHLESNMASALALQSPQEYQRWLLTYVRYLTRSKSSPASSQGKCVHSQNKASLVWHTPVPDLPSWAVYSWPLQHPDNAGACTGMMQCWENSSRLEHQLTSCILPCRFSVKRSPPLSTDQRAGEGQEVRLKELCSELMGPVRLGQGSGGPVVLGLDTRVLLQDQVLNIIGSNRSHQRLVNDFMEQLRECA